MESILIDDIMLQDIRFDTSTTLSGSDARSKSPDYSCIYIVIKTNKIELSGYSLVFTLGKGNSVIKSAINEYIPLLKNNNLQYITDNFRTICHNLTNDQQMCWIGPDKGAYYMAAGGLINCIWDLWSRYENKPLWKLITDMTSQQLISLLDFNYMEPVIKETDAFYLLNENFESRYDRVNDIKKDGLEAYTTSIGWSGYSNDLIKQKCKQSLETGFKNFKMKVGSDLENDLDRSAIIRKEIGWNKRLMMDSNGIWDYNDAKTNMMSLKKFNPYWIEEPTHPDDIIAHSNLLRDLYPIKIATGEQCPNKIMFKQFIQFGGFSILQTDINRLAGLNEWLVVALMAKKYGIPICTHAGGVGLCQMAAHLAAIDYICIAHTSEDRITEYVDHLQEHFVNPVTIRDGCYELPSTIGLGLELKNTTIEKYAFPDGTFWKINNTIINDKMWYI